MSASVLLALVAAALALLCLPPPAPLAAPSRADEPTGARWPPIRRRAMTVCAAVVAIVVLVGVWPWWCGLLLGAGLGGATLRLPQRRSAGEREVDRRRLAVHADLLAACLDAGMSVGSALLALSRPGPERDPEPSVDRVVRSRSVPTDPDDPLARLDAVAALLLLGADPERAWQGAQEHPDLTALAAAARRTASGGAAFADAVREHAVVLRAAAADAAERSAGRAGVAITAPLGLCFLPAFLCLGLAPVVVGLLSSLHLF